jgi:hypothetical protein
VAKLVYIGGYGRSGSTLLEYLLTAQPKVVACGEVERHLRRFGRRKVCTCGRLSKKCPVWKAFQHKSGKLKGWDHAQLDLALLDHVSGDYAVMVDSSKTAWGSLVVPFRLARRLQEDFLLVHLVRDPRGVCWSTMRPPSRPKKARREQAPATRLLRTALGWTHANLACEMFGRLYPDRYLRVRYEDLVQAPLQVIEQILNRVSLKAPLSLDPAETRDNRHQLYGNAMRFKIVSLAELKEDVAWKTEMPRTYWGLAAGLTWPLRRRYDYGRVVRP